MARKLSAGLGLAVLAGLTLVAWGVFLFEALMNRALHVTSLATAVMFTLMLVAWPFILGLRVAEGAVRQMRICRECNTVEGLEAFGFCLQCGAAGKAMMRGH